LFAISIESLPLILTIPIPASPIAVEIAEIVSSHIIFTSLIDTEKPSLELGFKKSYFA